MTSQRLPLTRCDLLSRDRQPCFGSGSGTAASQSAVQQIEVEVDGSSFGVASNVILANVREVAFGGMVTETADPFDGQLDVVAVPPGWGTSRDVTRCRTAGEGCGALVAYLNNRPTPTRAGVLRGGENYTRAAPLATSPSISSFA